MSAQRGGPVRRGADVDWVRPGEYRLGCVGRVVCLVGLLLDFGSLLFVLSFIHLFISLFIHSVIYLSKYLSMLCVNLFIYLLAYLFMIFSVLCACCQKQVYAAD